MRSTGEKEPRDKPSERDGRDNAKAGPFGLDQSPDAEAEEMAGVTHGRRLLFKLPRLVGRIGSRFEACSIAYGTVTTGNAQRTVQFHPARKRVMNRCKGGPVAQTKEPLSTPEKRPSFGSVRRSGAGQCRVCEPSQVRASNGPRSSATASRK